jgi:hypothetical protein
MDPIVIPSCIWNFFAAFPRDEMQVCLNSEWCLVKRISDLINVVILRFDLKDIANAKTRYDAAMHWIRTNNQTFQDMGEKKNSYTN